MHIHLKGLRQNNLKNISINIPKEKIVVFTGVSGSGKSSIVFDTIAAESQRQMNETYPAFIRGRLPKYEKPHVDYIDNLTAPVIVDQTKLGGNVRSTIGTISDLYASLRLLFSRIGIPKIGTASYFSFNDPKGMCKKCAGIGKVAVIDMEAMLDNSKSWMEGCVKDSLYAPGSWYWKQYKESGIFDVEKPLNEYSSDEYNLLIYGSRDGKSEQEYPKIEGLYNHYTRLYLKRDTSNMSKHTKKKSENLIKEQLCPACKGKRLNEEVLNCKIKGYSIADMCEMEFVELLSVLKTVDDKKTITIIQYICNGLKRMIDIGLPYLHLNRESSTLSGGEAQRVKLVRYMGSSLTGMTYIFDEPSTGLHPRDVNRMNQLLIKLRNKGNTVLVVEHDKDVISIADEIIDVGPCAGKEGGNIVFQGSYKELLQADTLTSKAMKINVPLKEKVRKVQGYFPIKNAKLHNLKNISINIPKNVMTMVTGVAGSGKSTLISQVFAETYKGNVVKVDQGPITATNRSTPATFLGFFDEIRKLFASENGVDEGLFSFNSKGSCPVCKGKGVIVTELVFMDPVITECEACSRSRYSEEALSYRYREKNIVEVLSMTVGEALIFFEDKKIRKILQAMKEVGLSYMTLGQPLQTLSGGERQRMKLAKYINKKGNIYILDEPTTGLHISDINKLLQLFEKMVDRGNTVIIIEHNLEVMKQADWIIDIGPDGGKNGGQVVFEGTPKEMLKKGNTITAKCLRKEIAG
ncbi:excinuclease ABC subunit UvrA [Clostridium sp. P21]|uniref:UvrABC system protein A n=1 Tax=Clostridium muellerianum TaxID=2716538 RepID=A0A7Y0EFT9_9CLOT|nr:excinuclease ABC subunit UvrA [Clostridium muellerianum]NMM62632.1 excinuclease ABC subunit UvrA [Clostridium muellerianum]